MAVWFVEAMWTDTSHGKDCEDCHGEMLRQRAKFTGGNKFTCICPASEADDGVEVKCICVYREATHLERRAFNNGLSLGTALAKSV